jgi:hypothetical protein
MANEPRWGSPEWRTHLRRSLAQRKRHGEKITDIEGLIDYIQAKGPGKGDTSGKSQKRSNSAAATSVHKKAKAKRSGQHKGGGKKVVRHQRQKARPQAVVQQIPQKGVTVIKAGATHEFLGI